MAKRKALRVGGVVSVDEHDVQDVLKALDRAYICKKTPHGDVRCFKREWPKGTRGQKIATLPRLWSRRLYNNLPVHLSVELVPYTRADGTMTCRAYGSGPRCTMTLRQSDFYLEGRTKQRALEEEFGSTIRHELAHAVQFQKPIDLEEDRTRKQPGPWHLRSHEIEAILSQSERDLEKVLLRVGARPKARPDAILNLVKHHGIIRTWEKENPAAYRRALQMAARVLDRHGRVARRTVTPAPPRDFSTGPLATETQEEWFVKMLAAQRGEHFPVHITDERPVLFVDKRGPRPDQVTQEDWRKGFMEELQLARQKQVTQ